MKKSHSRNANLAVKALLALALFLPLPAADCAAAGGEGGSMPAEAHFVIRLRPASPQRKATEEEMVRIRRHFEYLKGLQEEGKLLLAGLAEDDFQEIVIIRAKDRLEAERIMAGDPAVGGNLYLAELHPFRVVLAPGRP